MGIAFTIDSAIKVAHYGISSVMSLVDDALAEQMREHHSKENNLEFTPIPTTDEDFRANRITAYLDLVYDLVNKNFDRVKQSAFEAGSEITKYFELLADDSPLKDMYNKMLSIDVAEEKLKLQNALRQAMQPGSIDVNIMTKLDKVAYKKKDALPNEFNDAHAALRGYANSKLDSGIVFSAGMNPRLYSYISSFKDFFPDANGYIKKRIILKVSDYRSSLIQGKFLAKKGLWVSEYRIESGLNCGGHAFASDGFLMGPILDQFKEKRQELVDSIHSVVTGALEAINSFVPALPLPVKITAQGGVGTAEEHNFLRNHYNMDSVGWGTPFLLVPEAVTVDEPTRLKLTKAKEEDLYLSNISPLGVPFNSLRGNTKDQEKLDKIAAGRPGSSCPLQYLVSNKEYTERAICTASRQYQKKKLAELDEMALPADEHQKQFDKITDKSCICVGLGTSAVVVNKLENKVRGEGISICPGPNMAYFEEIISLKKMASHIYGRLNVLSEGYRPNMFIKEMGLYVDYLENKIKEAAAPTTKQMKYFDTFQANMNDGIAYYKNLFGNVIKNSQQMKDSIAQEIDVMEQKLKSLQKELELVVA